MLEQEELLTLLQIVATSDKERWIFKDEGFVYIRVGLSHRVYDFDNNELHFDDRENACKDVYKKLNLLKRVSEAFNQSYKVTVGKRTKEGEDIYATRADFVDVIVNGESMQKSEALVLNPYEKFIELEIAVTLIDYDRAQTIKRLIEEVGATVRDVVLKRLY